MNEHHHGPGFLNGFILGLLMGAGLMFLFGTNKGRKVLQMLLEQVEENTSVSDLLEMPEEEEEEEYMDGVEEEPEQEMDVKESKPQKVTAKVKRFFKGASKKLVS